MRERILAVIEKNSRISVKELADLLGENEAAVAAEIAEMENEHIICGYHTLINWDNTDEEKVIALIEAAERVGKTTVRLHTGDSSIYGAVREQFDELEKLGNMLGVEVCKF